MEKSKQVIEICPPFRPNCNCIDLEAIWAEPIVKADKHQEAEGQH